MNSCISKSHKALPPHEVMYFKTPQNLIIMETIPSLKHDIHPYNNAAFSICREFGVRFAATLVGESHLWDDGIHVRHQSRPLLVVVVVVVATFLSEVGRVAMKTQPRSTGKRKMRSHITTGDSINGECSISR